MQGDYKKQRIKAVLKIKNMSSNKLLEEMQDYNIEFRGIARKELRNRGAINEAQPRKRRRYNPNSSLKTNWGKFR